MKPNSKKRIGRIALGILFLLNPNVNVVDLLPDFIGCLLILSGLSSLRDISDSLEEARLNFLRLFWVSLSHIPAFVIMIMISSTYMSEKTIILVFAFVYAVIEFILVNNALTSLLDGFVYIGERHNGDCCFYEIKKNGKRVDIGRLRIFTTLFLIATKALTVAPNLVYLYDTSLGYGTVLSPYARNPVDFIGPATVLCFAPALIIGIIWASKMFRYIKGIANDKEFTTAIDGVLSDKALQSTAEYKYRKTSTLVCILVAAVILSVDLYIDEFNVIPDIICAVLLLSGALFAKKHFSDISKLPVLLCSIYAVAELALLAIAVVFSSSFHFADVGRRIESDQIYAAYVAMLALCEILFSLSFVSVMVSYMKALCSGFSIAVRAGHKKNGRDVFLEAQKKRNIASYALALLCGICHVVYLISMGNMVDVKLQQNAYITNKVTYLPMFEGFWMIMLAVNIIFAAFVFYSLSKTKEELKERLYII